MRPTGPDAARRGGKGRRVNERWDQHNPYDGPSEPTWESMNGSGGYPAQQGAQGQGQDWGVAGGQDQWGSGPAAGSGGFAAAGAGGYPPGAFPANPDFGYRPPDYDDGFAGQEPKRRTGMVVLSSLAVLLIILLATLSLTLWVTSRDSGDSDETGGNQGPGISAHDGADGQGREDGQPVSGSEEDSAQDRQESSAPSSTQPSTPSSTKPRRPDPPAGVSLCGTADGELFARSGSGNSVTSCPFAQSVRDAYVATGAEGGAATVQAHSPVTGQTYTMACSPAGENVVRCTGGNNAVVYVY